MQTFLPYESFIESAKCLDNKRLGKQRVECLQILQNLTGESDGWQSHPAVKMWRGYEQPLITYTFAICDEWIGRGYKDSIRIRLPKYVIKPETGQFYAYPPWLGGPIHDSHKAALLRKDPDWYGRFGWEVDVALPYYWPSKEI